MTLLRLQKIISDSGLLSRRKADLLIKEGRVTLNGRQAIVGEKADPFSDNILVDGIDLPNKQKYKVFLLNKPYGFISSCHDNYGRKTILSLIPPDLQNGIHPVGRLDSDSRGAILLTNNGNLTLRLTHPKYSHTKTYLVWLKGIVNKNIINKWRNGVIIDNRKTMPADIKLIKMLENKTLLQIILKEGRNRQIRKTAERMGLTVIDLQRIAISNIFLNELKEGEWRELNQNEWMNIIKNKEYNQ